MGDWVENDLVFPSLTGSPTDQRNLIRFFKRVLKKAGLPDIHFHDLRHTAATLMLLNGIPLIVVSRRLGHSKPSVTLDIYGHYLPGMQKEAAAMIDELVTLITAKWQQPGESPRRKVRFNGICGGLRKRYRHIWCAPGGSRTHNLLIRSQTLCPLSYGCSR